MYVGLIEDTCAVLEVEDICLVYRILDMGEEASNLCLNETSVCAGEGASALGLSALAVTAEKLRTLVYMKEAIQGAISDSEFNWTIWTARTFWVNFEGGVLYV